MSDYGNWSARGRAPDGASENDLREALTSERTRRRQEATLALVERAGDGLDPATVEALLSRASDDEDEEVRQFAVEALGVAGARPDAIRDCLTDRAEWVRAEAVVALSRADPTRTDPLRETLASDDSGWVRRNAVIALGKVGAADHDLLVETITNDPHPAVREYAAQFLAGAAEETAEAERVLAALLAREPNPFVRAKAAESLGELGTERAERALEVHGVTDRSDDVVRTARRALAVARGTDPNQLDVDVPDPAAPGSGPDAPGDRDVDGFHLVDGGPPGGSSDFDPTNDLDTTFEDRT